MLFCRLKHLSPHQQNGHYQLQIYDFPMKHVLIS